MGKIKDKTGEIRIMNNGAVAKIIEYENALNVKVRFEESGWVTTVRYNAFKDGRVFDPYVTKCCGHGVCDISSLDDFGNESKSYKTWTKMLGRCYSKLTHSRQPTYIGCNVCEEWLLYSNFKRWYDDNIYHIDNQRMELDKDIVGGKNNKTYSPSTCVFVPKNINALFTKSNSARGDTPIGVSKKGNKYRAMVSINGRDLRLGSFSTQNEAFDAYKVAKEKHIKKVADEYREFIPSVLYKSMYNYEVEITD